MKARDLAVPYPTVRMETDGLTAARLLTEHNRPGLIVVDEHDHPIAVLPGSQVLRVMIPTYVQDDPDAGPGARRGVRRHHLRPAGGAHGQGPGARRTVRRCRWRNDDDTVLEIAAIMAANRSPLVAVLDGKGKNAPLLGRRQHP